MPISKEQVLQVIKGSQWNVQSFSGMPLYLMCAATLSGWRVKEELGVGYSHFFFLFSKGRAHMYYDEKDWRTIAEAYYARIHSEDELKGMIARWRSKTDEAQEAFHHVDPRQLSSEALVELTRNLAACITDSVGTGHALEGITFGSEERLKQALEKRNAFSVMDFSLLCSPIYSSFMTEVQQALLHIKHLPESEERDAAVQKYIDGFTWAEATYCGAKKLMPQEVLARAEDLKEITVLDMYEVSEQKQALMNKLAFTSEERFIVKTIEMSFKWQDDRKMHILKSIVVLDSVIDCAAERFGIDPDRKSVV